MQSKKPGRLTASSRQELQEGTRNCASPSGRGLARRSGRSATPGVTLAGPRRYAALLLRTGYVRSGTGP
jgi:hypothetical protein